MNELELITMNIVVDSGSARSYAMEAVQSAKLGAFDKANELMESASADISKAHHAQTELIQREARGEETPVSLLLIHAQDHLMTAMSVIDMAREFIDLYKLVLR